MLKDSLGLKQSLQWHNSQWNPLFMSDTDIKCQGLWQLSKYRSYNHRPGISLVFICHVGKLAVLGQHSHWIKQICSIWHQVAACHLKVFFYDKSTGSLECVVYHVGLSSITLASDLWRWRHLSLLYPTSWFLIHQHLLLNYNTCRWCPPDSPHPDPKGEIWRQW